MHIDPSGATVPKAINIVHQYESVNLRGDDGFAISKDIKP